MRERSSLEVVAILDRPSIQRFAEHLAGQLISPDDPAYESARWSWNRAFDRRPGLIVRCADATDVQRAVDFARSNDLLVAVRGGGHSFAGHSTCDDGLVIDLSTADVRGWTALRRARDIRDAERCGLSGHRGGVNFRLLEHRNRDETVKTGSGPIMPRTVDHGARLTNAQLGI